MKHLLLLAGLTCVLALSATAQTPSSSAGDIGSGPFEVCNPNVPSAMKCFYLCTFRRRPMDQPCFMGLKPTYAPEAEYSDKARREKISGEVMLRITVGTDGKVTDAKVMKSLEPSLDESALKTVRTWKFDPGTVDGKAVTVVLPVEMTFRIR